MDNNNPSDGFTLMAGSSSGLPFDFNGVALRDLNVSFIDAGATVFSDVSLPATLSLVNFDVAEMLLTQTLDGTTVDFGSTGQIDALDDVTDTDGDDALDVDIICFNQGFKEFFRQASREFVEDIFHRRA